MADVQQEAELRIAPERLELARFLLRQAEILNGDARLFACERIQDGFEIGINVVADGLRHVEGQRGEQAEALLPARAQRNVVVEGGYVLFLMRGGQLVVYGEHGVLLAQRLIERRAAVLPARLHKVEAQHAHAVQHLGKVNDVFSQRPMGIMPYGQSVFHGESLPSPSRSSQPLSDTAPSMPAFDHFSSTL